MLAYYRNEDLSIAGRQHRSSNGRYICTFEGSLVNEQELRKKLEKTGIYSSFTRPEELIIELYRFCGDSFAKVLRGKFTTIIFDKEKKQLIAARDRYGVRPLYYTKVVDGIGITSKLENFKPSTGWALDKLSQDSLRHYFSYGYIPENNTYLKNIHHLPAGCHMKYSNACGLTITPFADMLVIEGSNNQLVDEQLLYDAVTEGVQKRIIADNPAGVFYTGKTEELAIAGITKQACSRIKVFSAEFRKLPTIDKSLESCLIRRQVNAADYWIAALRAIQALGVPIADPAAPIDYLLAELARKYVDIIISADGADILFGAEEKVFERLKKRNIDDLLFTEAEKDELLKFKGKPWNEITDSYLAQILDLDGDSRWQTLELNFRLRGSTILKKERLTAHHGLEARYPFLDDEVLNIVSFLTNNEKKSMFLFKQIFASQLSKLPEPKKKDAHNIPLAKWIRTDLYEYIKSIFEQDIVEDFFNVEEIFSMLEQHRKGTRDLSYQIWSVTMFIVWLRNL